MQLLKMIRSFICKPKTSGVRKSYQEEVFRKFRLRYLHSCKGALNVQLILTTDRFTLETSWWQLINKSKIILRYVCCLVKFNIPGHIQVHSNIL